MASRWYIILTNPKCEEKAERNLRRSGFTVYAPLARIERFARRKKIWREVTLRLFPRYLFVQIDAGQGGVPWFVLRSCEGVDRVLGADGSPCFLRQQDELALCRVMDAEAARLFDETRAGKLFRREIGRTKAETTKLYFPPGSNVRLKRGPFAGHVGEVVNVNGRGAIEALVKVFGALTPVEIPVDFAEMLDESSEAA